MMKSGKLGMLVVLTMLLGMQSCGKDDDSQTNEPCTNQNCDNPQLPATNLIGTWRVYEDQNDFNERETVTFNADSTGVADEDNSFSVFSNGETISVFDWEYQENEEQYIVRYDVFGRFYKILELDCDYMKLEDQSSITGAEKLKFILCRE